MRPVRVATWNLWWRNGPFEDRQLAIEATLGQVNADIVGLQEVSLKDPDHLRWLAADLGYHSVQAPRGEGDRWGLGNAIVSRWPFVSSSWEYLDVGDMPPHRTVLGATIDAPMGPIDVWTTHLSHGFDQSALRVRQLRQIGNIVAGHRTRVADADRFPPVLLGDLNAVPDSDEIRMMTGRSDPSAPGLVFTDCWEHVGDGPGATYSDANPYVNDSAWPQRRLDYVMVGWPRRRPMGNPMSAELFGQRPLDDVVASDHYGVVVDLAGSFEE
jgi:endonuclease/exonuclease/phosphatase family metal-dependent hydrolase